MASGEPSPEQQGVLALQSLGGRLRQARDAQGLTAAALADRLRIGVEQLEALEAADLERLPERVFVVAQARRVASALGLDISTDLEALRAAADRQPAGRGSRPAVPTGSSGGPQISSHPPAAARRGTAGTGASRPLLVAGLVVLVLAAVGGGWWYRSARQPSQPDPSRPSGSLPPSLSAGAGSAVPAPAPAADPSVAAAPPAGSVVLASREPSWVEVRRSDGSIVFRGLLRGARVFSLDKGLRVLAGRPDLVTTRVGSEPARPLGPISAVRWRSLPAVP